MYALIADDHDLFRQGLVRALSEKVDDLALLEANSMQSARRIIQEYHQKLDLVLLDHCLPDGKGLELLKEIQLLYPLLPIAMLSAREDYILMQESIDAGAVGFLPKSTTTAILLGAINLLLSGGIYIPPNLYQMSQQAETATTTFMLTTRQEEVLQLVSCGCSNKEIAYRLNIAEATVKAHVTVILRSRGVDSRSMLRHEVDG